MTRDLALPPTFGAIIAGGRARRLGGGDKVLCPVAGRPVLAWLVERLAPQVKCLVLNTNGDPARFAAFGLAVAADGLADRPGPLAGILSALEWAAEADPTIEWLLTVPGDAPFLPRDLVQRLHDARDREAASIACAASHGRIHPIAALWPVSLAEALRRALVGDGLRKVEGFRQRFACSIVEWPADPVDPFFNINTAENLAEADRLAGVYPNL